MFLAPRERTQLETFLIFTEHFSQASPKRLVFLNSLSLVVLLSLNIACHCLSRLIDFKVWKKRTSSSCSISCAISCARDKHSASKLRLTAVHSGKSEPDWVYCNNFLYGFWWLKRSSASYIQLDFLNFSIQADESIQVRSIRLATVHQSFPHHAATRKVAAPLSYEWYLVIEQRGHQSCGHKIS